MTVAAGRYSAAAIYLGAPGGQPVVLQSVTVLNHGTTTPASLYTDKIAGTAAANPVLTDQEGNYSFFAAPGDYDLVFTLGDVVITQTVTVRPDPSNPVSATGASNSSGFAAAASQSLANGTAAQLTQTTADSMLYLQVGTAGTAFALAIGPTSTPANTIFTGAAVASGEVISVRVPAGWYVKWSATTATLASQVAVTC